jgi:hypothetical protein
LLDEASCHQSRFVLDHRAQLVLLELEYPLQGAGVVAVRQWHQLLGVVLLDGLQLLLHRCSCAST